MNVQAAYTKCIKLFLTMYQQYSGSWAFQQLTLVLCIMLNVAILWLFVAVKMFLSAMCMGFVFFRFFVVYAVGVIFVQLSVLAMG